MTRRKSLLWALFERIDDHRAKCLDCKQKFSYRTSTSNLAKHLRRKHPSIIHELTAQGNLKLPASICDKSIDDEDYSDTLQKTHEVFISETNDGEELDSALADSPKPHTPSATDRKSRDRQTDVKKDNSSRKSSEPAYKIFKSSDSPCTSTSKLSLDECETFGKIVASHLRELPVSVALECQSDILHHLVQKRLGRSSLDTRLHQYSNDGTTEQIIVQAWDNTD